MVGDGDVDGDGDGVGDGDRNGDVDGDGYFVLHLFLNINQFDIFFFVSVLTF